MVLSVAEPGASARAETAMPLLAALTLLALATLPARADVLPPPEWYQMRLAQQARELGQDCPDPALLEEITKDDRAIIAARGLAARRLRCANGRRFLVSMPRHGIARPGLPPMPPPYAVPVD